MRMISKLLECDELVYHLDEDTEARSIRETSSIYPFKIYVDQKAARVPQTAITTATVSKSTSKVLHRPESALFANTGPMTQIMNAEKDPRNAITALNSGTRIDTPTDRNVNTTRSIIVRMRLRFR